MNYDFKEVSTDLSFVTSGRKVIVLDQWHQLTAGNVLAVGFPAKGPAVLTTSSTGYALFYPSMNNSQSLIGYRNVSMANSPQLVDFQPSVSMLYIIPSEIHLSYNFTTVSVQQVSVSLKNPLGNVEEVASVAVLDAPFGLKLLLPAALSFNKSVKLTGSLLRGTNVTYLWDMGDGCANISTDNPWLLHTFNNTGTKHIKLMAMNKVRSQLLCPTEEWCFDDRLKFTIA